MKNRRISSRRFRAVGDLLCLRDPRGASRSPSIAVDGGDYVVLGPFLMMQEYRISKEAGIRFTGVTRDPNPIHVHDEIVPGALTVSKSMIPLEILFPRLRIRSLRAKFTGSSFYGQRTVSRFRIAPLRDAGLEVEVETSQSGRTIAKMEILACPGVSAPRNVPAKAAGAEMLSLIRQYLDCLNVDGSVFVDKFGAGEVEFPLGFIASLPSGEMVRKLKGQGGILNMLELEFPPENAPAACEGVPAVEISQERVRSTYNKISARISDGSRTFGRGFALVLAESREPAGSSA